MIQTKCKNCGKISPVNDDICDACGSIDFIIVDSEGKKEPTARISEISGATAKPVEEKKAEAPKEEKKKEESKEDEEEVEVTDLEDDKKKKKGTKKK